MPLFEFPDLEETEHFFHDLLDAEWGGEPQELERDTMSGIAALMYDERWRNVRITGLIPNDPQEGGMISDGTIAGCPQVFFAIEGEKYRLILQHLGPDKGRRGRKQMHDTEEQSNATGRGTNE